MDITITFGWWLVPAIATLASYGVAVSKFMYGAATTVSSKSETPSFSSWPRSLLSLPDSSGSCSPNPPPSRKEPACA